MKIKSLDHLVITCENLQKTTSFYTKILMMKEITFKGGRKALLFGNQKINLHEKGKEFEPKASSPTPGAIDLCFISDDPISSWIEHLKIHNIKLIDGPVERTGAVLKLLSIYVRDPDNNLIEISNQINNF